MTTGVSHSFWSYELTNNTNAYLLRAHFYAYLLRAHFYASTFKVASSNSFEYRPLTNCSRARFSSVNIKLLVTF
jgi:hypothetical protein